MKKFLVVFISLIFLAGGMSFASKYSQEYQDAYDYAYSQGITTVTPINKANIYGGLTRISMAKMISKFAINVLGMIPDSSLDCSFLDVSEELDLGYGYGVKKACQLGLMGIGSNGKISTNFNPKGTVTRGQWATVFSRALSKYNGDTVVEVSPYYKSHLNYLYSKGIVKNVENPPAKSVEKRGNVMLMMYRVSQSVKNYEEPDLIGGFENEIQSETESFDNNSDSIVYHRVDNSYSQFLMNDFNDIEDMYKDIKEGDRVIFLVRHSERVTNCSSEGGLTEHGIELAKGVGLKLQGAPFEDTSRDFYGSSTVKRTLQTSYYVGRSRGSIVLDDKLDDNIWNEYNNVNHGSNIDSLVYGNYFSDGNSYSSIEHLYEENKNITDERALSTINSICTITEGHPFSWITSHDWFTLPITEWATNEDLSFSQSNSERPNYMQGVAIIVHKDGGWEIYPVRSLELGKMKTWENPSC